MVLQNLYLRDYRNIDRLQLAFHPKLNIIIGPNGAGKTNILESLLVTSNTRSFRTNEDSDLITKSKEHCLIDVLADKQYRVVISRLGKSLFINRDPISKTSDFIGRFNCVLFKPGDIELFSQSSRERRKLIDLEVGKVSKIYLKTLVDYNKLLKEKNCLLKSERIDENYLMTLDEMMAPLIYEIIKERLEFVTFINNLLSDAYFELSGEQHEIFITYKPSFDLNIDTILSDLKVAHKRDLILHYTSIGPQREDITFKYDDFELTSVASQGQKRMVMIAFKMALIAYIESKTNEKPLVLLDDILSELDVANKERLLKKIPLIGQTIITGTDILNLNINYPCRVIAIEKGAINGVNDY